MQRLYVIVASHLGAGLKCAQAIHAFRQFADDHPYIEGAWHHGSNNIAVLESPNLAEISYRIRDAGFAVSEFREPDRDGELTAIAVEPRGRRLLRRLPLAGASTEIAALSRAAEGPTESRAVPRQARTPPQPAAA